MHHTMATGIIKHKAGAFVMHSDAGAIGRSRRRAAAFRAFHDLGRQPEDRHGITVISMPNAHRPDRGAGAALRLGIDRRTVRRRPAAKCRSWGAGARKPARGGPGGKALPVASPGRQGSGAHPIRAGLVRVRGLEGSRSWVTVSEGPDGGSRGQGHPCAGPGRQGPGAHPIRAGLVRVRGLEGSLSWVSGREGPDAGSRGKGHPRAGPGRHGPGAHSIRAGLTSMDMVRVEGQERPSSWVQGCESPCRRAEGIAFAAHVARQRISAHFAIFDQDSQSH